MSERRSSSITMICRAAARQARTDLDDTDAKATLEPQVRAQRDGIAAAVDALRRRRADFIGDRAFRLLDAVARNAPVEPIAAEKITLFAQEAELGRLPLPEAYARLVELEPRLDRVAVRSRREVSETHTTPRMRLFSMIDQGKTHRSELRGLVGPCAQHGEPLMRSELALSIALQLQYLAVMRGELPQDASSSSYFSSRRRVAVRSGTLLGGNLRPP